MKNKIVSSVFLVLSLSAGYAFADNSEFSDELSGVGGTIISKYLQATQSDSKAKTSAMQVDIDASVPSLNQSGHLKALRKISNIGKITYRVLGFQGDNNVKSQVIGRYLQAEQQGQNDQTMQINPLNYKFKFKGNKLDVQGNSRYVFQLSPRQKRQGLFKGEIWLDAQTCLPVVEKGRLVKNPSVFFRKVDFVRVFSIQNGIAVPDHLKSTIDTRLVGKVNLSINYSAAELSAAEDDSIAESTAQAASASLP